MDDLLEQGIAAYKAGNRDEARKIFVSLVEQSPDDKTAWEWMYKVCKTDKGRVHCLNQILRIDPKDKNVARLLKKITTSKPLPKSKRPKIKLKPVIWVSTVLICLIGTCVASLFFSDNTIDVSKPIIDTPIPIEKAIEMTFSFSNTQSASFYSPIPMTPSIFVSLSPAPAASTATSFIFEMQTQSQILRTSLPTETYTFTPLPVYETPTPFIYAYPTDNQSPPVENPSSSGDPCCKHCGSDSQPCGDSCISNNYTCNKPKGCACY